jgi:hypothetical protein
MDSRERTFSLMEQRSKELQTADRCSRGSRVGSEAAIDGVVRNAASATACGALEGPLNSGDRFFDTLRHLPARTPIAMLVLYQTKSDDARHRSHRLIPVRQDEAN